LHYKIALNDAAPQASLLKHGLWGTTAKNQRLNSMTKKTITSIRLRPLKTYELVEAVELIWVSVSAR
jgi:hypothetical protein